MATAKLSIDLEARLGRLEGDMGRANKLMEQSARRMEASFGGAAAKIGDAFKAISAVAVVGAIANITRNTIAGLDALNDMADATGSTVEKMSALEDVAVRTGTGVDTVTSSVIKFNSQIQEGLKPGSEAAGVFKLLGLNAKELAELDPADALAKTARELAKWADDGNKAAVVQALFGKSVREVAPFLKDLAAAGELNATVTAEQAKAAEDFNKNIAALQKNVTDLVRDGLGPALAAINGVADAFRGTGKYTQDLAGSASALAVPLQAIAVLGSNVAYVFRETGREIGALAAQAKALATGNLEAFRAIRSERLADAAAARKSIDDLDARLLGANAVPSASYSNEGRSRSAPSLPRVVFGGTKGSGAAKRPDIFGPDVPDAVADAIKRLEGADEEKLKRLRDTLLQLGNIVSAGGKVPDSVFAQIAEDMAKLDPAAVAAKEALEEGRRVFEATRTPAEQLATEIDRLNKLLQSGAIDWDTYGRAQFAAQDKFDEAIKKNAEKVDEFAKKFRESFQDVLGDGLVDLMEGNFDNIGKSFQRMLNRMVADALAADITRALFGGGPGKGGAASGGGIGDIAGSLLGKLGGLFGGNSSSIGSWTGGGVDLGGVGKWFSSLFSGFFADGGYIPPGRWGIAGESGPEPVFGGRAGATVRANGGMVVHQSFTFSGPVDTRTQQQLAAAASRGLAIANRRGM